VLREQYAAKYKPDHPVLRELESQVKQAREILAAAEAARTEQTQGPNKIYQETSVALEQRRPQLEAVRARIAKIKQQIGEFNDELDRFTASERKFAKLEREVEVLEANYRKYFVNLEHSRIDAKLQAEELSNIAVAQPATLNLKPYAPNKLINLAAALFLGSVGGVGLAVFLEYLRPSLNIAEDYEAALNAPVIASIPDLDESELLPLRKKHASMPETETVDAT
jgi:tyrosine-protein kinase Etk/Wzc